MTEEEKKAEKEKSELKKKLKDYEKEAERLTPIAYHIKPAIEWLEK
jgi:hypothetical protein